MVANLPRPSTGLGLVVAIPGPLISYLFAVNFL